VPAKKRRPEGGNGICYFWGFAAGILRMAALYFLGMRRLDSESPQQSHSHNVTADQIILCFLINIFIYRNYHYKVALGIIVSYGRVFEV
jgi:hypothetical protein